MALRLSLTFLCGLSTLVAQRPDTSKSRGEIVAAVLKAIDDKDSGQLTQLSRELSDPTPANLATLDALLREKAKAREFSATTLAATGTREYTAHLLTGIRKETDSGVRENMLEALHGIKNPDRKSVV